MSEIKNLPNELLEKIILNIYPERFIPTILSSKFFYKKMFSNIKNYKKKWLEEYRTMKYGYDPDYDQMIRRFTDIKQSRNNISTYLMFSGFPIGENNYFLDGPFELIIVEPRIRDSYEDIKYHISGDFLNNRLDSLHVTLSEILVKNYSGHPD